MSPDLNRVDTVVQYALLLAGERDEEIERELGPIHLIKYVYLADLAYARKQNGATFTGIEWQFYSFGPWSPVVYERIDPALSLLGAAKKERPSNYEGKENWLRWSRHNDYELEAREKALPAVVAMALRQCVKRFGNDTASLLRHVYRTPPMLEAAPREMLDFGIVAQTEEASAKPLPLEPISEKKAKRLREAMRRVQEQAASRSGKQRELVNPVSKPRHDEVYEQGVKWLDSLAGEPIEPGEKTAQFSEDVWKSSTRKGTDVP